MVLNKIVQKIVMVKTNFYLKIKKLQVIIKTIYKIPLNCCPPRIGVIRDAIESTIISFNLV